MNQKKARNRRPGQQIELKIDGVRIVASLWMYRGTWVAETTMKGGRYYQAVGPSDLAVMQRLEAAIRTREARIRAVEQARSQGGPRPAPPGQPAQPAAGPGDPRRPPSAGGGPAARPPRPRGPRPEPGPGPRPGRPPGDGPPRGRPGSPQSVQDPPVSGPDPEPSSGSPGPGAEPDY